MLEDFSNVSIDSYLRGYNVREEIKKIINGSNTVDAVPVVKCGGCRYALDTYDDTGRRFCSRIRNYVIDDWFCANGEKKDSEIDDTTGI